VQLGKHPHIVRCLQVFKAEIGPEVFFVLELVVAAEGKRDASLRSWLTPGKPLSVEQALLFALHIARGMRHATAKIPELVHRDLKPENLLIGREGLLRVTDFGLATVTRSSTEGGGTSLYMAPEQWDQTNVDLRADIYAFGCILFEMLAGHPAVQPGSIQVLKKAHQTGQVRALPADLSSEVTALIRQCMAVRPEARYVTWSEVESAVENTYKVITNKNVPIEMTSQAELQSERVAMGWSYNAMGISYYDIGKFSVARDYFDKVLAIGQQEGERSLQGAALGNLGAAYADLGDARGAIGYHEQCLTIAHELGDRHGEGHALGGLGGAYHQLGDARGAIGYYGQCLTIARELGDRHGEGTAMGGLGNAYADLGDARSAIGYYEQRLVIAREIGDIFGAASTSFNLILLLLQQGRLREAEAHAKQAAQIFTQVGHREMAARAQGLLAPIRSQSV